MSMRIKNVSKTFDDGKTFALKDISLQISEGEIVVILGSSGCGKTTLLKMMNFLLEPTGGLIEIDDQPITIYEPIQLRRSIGYVFQDIGLFPHMTVAENISIVLRLLHKPQSERTKKSNELLLLMNLDPTIYANRKISELSGGQLQRVGVARALANDPKILLMDEPFAALDAITRYNLQDELLRLNRDLHKTIVFVTHDIIEALRLADRIVVMHQGRIEQVGTKKEILKQPKTEFVSTLFRISHHLMKEMATNNE